MTFDHYRDEAKLDERVRSAYRQPSPADEPARARLLARLAVEARSHAGWRGWFSVRAYHARPATVFAAMAAMLAAVLVAGVWLGARFAGGPQHRGSITRAPAGAMPASAEAGTAPVTFVLRAPGATRVSVVGDFNNWDANATPMAHSGSGDLWVLSVRLPRGVHMYSFVLDGSEWRPDPSAPLAADGSFGGHNSVIVVDGAKGL
jgi:hypothetical protein